MVEKFAFWLESIVEDDPLPDEVDKIVFKVCENGSFKYLEMLGLENELDLSKTVYRPLEAQFFNINDIASKNEKLFEYRLTNLIDEAFTSRILKQQFKGRKIYLFTFVYNYLFKV